MQYIEKNIDIKNRSTIEAIKTFLLFHSSGSSRAFKHIVFLDIETTGLKASESQLYMIGCLDLTIDSKGTYVFTLKQWFLESIIDEIPALIQLSDYIENIDMIVTFNGATFDLVYLRQVFDQYHLSCSALKRPVHFDLYQQLRTLKKLLRMDNCRLKSFEQCIGINREDQYSGFELIDIYMQYHTMYLKGESHVDPDYLLSLRHLLLLHNEEDITNLPHLMTLSLYPALFKHVLPLYLKSDIKVPGPLNSKLPCQLEQPQPVLPLHFKVNCVTYDNSNGTITIEGAISLPLVCSLSLCDDHLKIDWNQTHFHIELYPYITTLKMFFENYKDYFYLPEEDCAVHKKVGVFVDTAHRRNATKQTCYVNKAGVFYRQNRTFPVSALFRLNYSDLTAYMEMTDDITVPAVDSAAAIAAAKSDAASSSFWDSYVLSLLLLLSPYPKTTQD